MIITMPPRFGKGEAMPTSRFSQTDNMQGDTPVLPVPFWHIPRAALYFGDVRACLRQLPARLVHCAVTSPPYWNLRDYGTGQWEGGNADCSHVEGFSRGDTNEEGKRGSGLTGGPTQAALQQFKDICGKCGAKRTDMQIGAEPLADCDTYGQAQCSECFVCSIVGVMREVHRVLRDDGTLWLNLGDTFDNGEQGMIPALVALALRKDGWKLVQDIIWYASNKMPESVTNRCTKSHEHIFLLAKGDGYYYDSVAIEEQSASAGKPLGFTTVQADAIGRTPSGNQLPENYHKPRSNTKNKRDVWIVPTSKYPGAHFATFSPRLITPCILAGTSEHGCCARCGRPWERVVAKSSTGQTGGEYNPPGQSPHSNARDNRERSFEWSRNGKPGSGSTLDGIPATRETVGWRKVCGCQTNDVAPCTVLDPFVGSGTTVATAIELGRAGIGIDLNEIYLKENAIPRIEAATVGGVVRKPTTPIVHDTPPIPRRIRG